MSGKILYDKDKKRINLKDNSMHILSEDDSPSELLKLFEECNRQIEAQINAKSKTSDLFVVNIFDEEDNENSGGRNNTFFKINYLANEKFEIRTFNYVGVINFIFKKETIKIIVGSRFDEKDSYDFLSFMVNKSFSNLGYYLPNKINTSFNEVWNFFTALAFVDALKSSLKLGVYREYHNFEYNNSKPKGSINFSKHISLNYPFKNGKISYSTREYTANNPKNKLTLIVYELLKDKYSGILNVKDEIAQLYSVCSFDNNKIIILNQCRQKITHPYYINYEKLRRISLIILENKGIDLFKGNSNKNMFGIMINIAKLWEKTLENLLKKNINHLGLSISSQTAKAIMYDENYESITNAKPDFVVKNNNQITHILDAKYKPIWKEAFSDSEKLKNASADYYQMISYSQIFDCHNLSILFPLEKKLSKTQGIDNFDDDFWTGFSHISDNININLIPAIIDKSNKEDMLSLGKPKTFNLLKN